MKLLNENELAYVAGGSSAPVYLWNGIVVGNDGTTPEGRHAIAESLAAFQANSPGDDTSDYYRFYNL